MKANLTPEQADAISRISGLVLVNAMIFQEILAYHDPRVFSLQKIQDDSNLIASFSEHWKFILSDINYYPIFHLAQEIISNLSSDGDIVAALKSLAQKAQKIVGMRASLRHDLMGRVYHRLLADKKYLGTYFTSIPAAHLLLKLCLGYDVFPFDWDELPKISQLRIADLACGTGTLLMAAAETITDNYLRAASENHDTPDLESLHKRLAEEIIHGYDVLPSAIHLTASTLALRAPQIPFDKMNLFSLPMGGPVNYLGSIDFLDGRRIWVMRDMFGANLQARQMSGKGVLSVKTDLPDLDLCVMNPPFTRSVGGNLLFGSLPPEERAKAQDKLKRVVKRRGLEASITAGLGSVFVAVADRYIKPGGRLALVLPKALLSGVAWQPTRDLLRRRYRLEYVVASHDPQRWNFSESTSLSEVLLVARRLDPKQPTPLRPVVFVNLWRNPTTNFDALAVAQALKPEPPILPLSQGALEIKLGKEKYGEAGGYHWDDIKGWPSWILPCAFAQSDLIRTAYYLARGQLWLPGVAQLKPVPLNALSNFASLGPDCRDIHDGFNVSNSPTSYAAFWGHDAQAVFAMAKKPNAYLSPLAEAKEKRPLRQVTDLWPLAGKVLLVERIRLNSQPLISIRLPEPVLSNTWWPLSLKDRFNDENYEKAAVLWLNSTLGLILLFSNRLETEGAWIKFKKPVWANLPMLDLGKLTPEHMSLLAAAYDEVCQETLRPFPEMDGDPVRARIDQAIAQVLGLPDFSILRRLLAREPVVCLKRL